MNHIPWPKGRENSCPYVVARYIAEPYDGGTFLDWPARNGVEHLISGFLVPGSESVTGEEVAKHLQTWLFFGLLHEFVGHWGKASGFYEDTDDGRYLKLTSLPTAAMIQHLLSFDPGWQEKRARRRECLELLAQVVSVAAKLPDLDDTILPSILIAAETLDPESIEYVNNPRRGLETTSMWYALTLPIMRLRIPRYIEERLEGGSLSIYSTSTDWCERWTMMSSQASIAVVEVAIL